MKRVKVIVSLLAVTSIITITGCAFPGKKKEAGKQIYAMDTIMSMQAYGEHADEAVEAAVLEIERLDDLLSTGKSDSEIMRLNLEKRGILTEDTAYLIEKSLELYQKTQGAFDVSIYPIMRAWGFTDQNFRVPGEEELQELIHHVDASALQYDDDTKELKMPVQMEIDLGGIAKGYTGNRVAHIMKQYGIESALINLGGNVQTIGTKTDGSCWKIGIEDPEKKGNYIGVLQVKDKAVVTSGGYERNFEENGTVYHHIIDPATGYPAMNGLLSVTIVCEDGTLADGLSTSLYIMGSEGAVEFWKAHDKEFECVLFTTDKKMLVSKGLQGCISSEYHYEIIEAE